MILGDRHAGRESKLTPAFNIIILKYYTETFIIFGLRKTSN